MNALLCDFRESIRSIVRSPFFAIILVLLLTLGVGANTLIFTAVDALLLRPLPVSHPEQLVRFGIQMSPTFTYYDQPYSFFHILREQGGVFSDVFSAWPMEMSFVSADHVRNVEGETVSGNYFSALGLKPTLGRLFSDVDDQANEQVAVISSDFWRRQFADRRDIIGKTIRLRGGSFNIIGVLAPGFSDIDLENRPDVWIPMSAWRLWTPGGHSLSRVYMRMRPGVRISEAEAEVRALYPLMLSAFYQDRGKSAQDLEKEARINPPVVTSVKRGISAMRKQFTGAVAALLGGVSIFLVLVCANVGGLILQRNHARRRDAAIRISLGASRCRLTQRMLAEALLISCAGTAIGCYLAYMCGPLLLDLLPATRPLSIVLKPDALVVAFAVALCILTAGLTSITAIPNLVRTDPGVVIRRESGGNPSYGLGRGLAVVQIAIALVLLTGSFVLARTLSKLRAEDPGFIRDKLILVEINPRDMGATRETLPGIFKQALQKARLLPGVRSVSLAEEGPMQGVGLKATMLPAGSRAGTADSMNVSMNVVSLNHFDNIGVRLLEGREFEASDENKKPQPVLITANLAQEFFPGSNPIGQSLGPAGSNGIAVADYQVIGVVNNSEYRDMRDSPPTFYVLLDDDVLRFSNGMVLYVRTLGRTASVMHELGGMLQTIAPDLAPARIATIQAEINRSLWQERLLAVLTSTFAALSAVLAGVGLFAILAFYVSQRKREIGVRMALGSSIQKIIGLVMRDWFWIVLPGVLLGSTAYALCSRALAGLVVGVSLWDISSLVGANSILLATSVFAAIVPVIRAIRIEPSRVLRDE